MSKKPYLIILLCLAGLAISQRVFAQGLGFKGRDLSINMRTSYDVLGGHRIVSTSNFEVEFDLSFRMRDLGYILRIKDRGSEDGLIFNLFFDGQGDGLAFRFNAEGYSSLIVFDIPESEWPDLQWKRMKISFDVVKDAISLTIGDHRFYAADVGLPEKFSPVLIFGRSDHVIDVPTFAIKNLSVEGDSQKFTFGLNEYAGNAVHDERGRAIGNVSNPEWLIKDSYEWKLLGSFSSGSVAGAIYDASSRSVHYVNRDSITTFSVRTGEHTVHRFDVQCPVELTQGTCFIDQRTGRLYVYEVFSESSPPRPTVASLDLQTYEWRIESYEKLPTQLHHHSSWFGRETGRYTIFGGFGDMHYSKSFHAFDTSGGRWETISGFKGTHIFPRYFSSLGYSEANGSVYIFGGMGNESGEQFVGRKYFYDLHRIDLDSGVCEQLWSIPWEEQDMVPVRGMAISGEFFYTLCYPEHITDSSLSLYRFSMVDGSHEKMGNSIPICSDKITTNANLYYDNDQNRLYALVQEFTDDISSRLKIYALSFPPITAQQLMEHPGYGEDRTVMIVPIVLLLVISAGFVLCLKIVSARRIAAGAAKGSEEPGHGRERKTSRPNSVCLFGDFMVNDRDGREISYMFSVRLRQTICLILQHNDDGGITSKQLSSMLWPDRSEYKVKNSRGVTINHLRKVLGELDGVELVYDKGCFKIVHDGRFRCDALRLREIIFSGRIEDNRGEFVEIVSRGKFLKFAGDDPLFDSYKKEMEHLLEPILSIEMKRSFESEAFRTTIDLAEALFHIDPLNDDALKFLIAAMQRLKMNDAARIRQKAFIIEYKKHTGLREPPTSGAKPPQK